MPSMLVVSDLHIDAGRWGRAGADGHNSAYTLATRAWDYAVDQAIERRPDVVILDGDVFNHGHPWPWAIAAVGAGLARLSAAAVPTVLIVGNHELIRLPATQDSILRLWARMPHIYYQDVPGWLRIPDVDVSLACLPWPARPQMAQLLGQVSPDELDMAISNWLREQVQDLSLVQPDGPSALIGHAMVTGARMGSEQNLAPALVGGPQIAPQTLQDGPWDVGVLGHVHCHQQLAPRLYYAGTPWTIDFADAGVPHGPAWVEINGEASSVHLLPGPDRRLTVLQVPAGEEPEIDEDLEGSVVRVVMPDATPQQIAATRRLLAEVGAQIADIQVPTSRTERTGLRPIQADVDPIEALRQWGQARQLSDMQLEGMLGQARTMLD